MLQSYQEHGLHAPATFELFARTLPEGRNYLLACGLDSALTYLETLEFGAGSLAALERVGFPASFLDWLGELRFTGDVWALPEGTPAFGNEPLLTVEAPLPEAQVVETYLINQVHFQTLVASKGARVVTAAAGRPVADFGGRRAHGTDAGLRAARAMYLAGMASTSNVAAGARYGIPVTGTMAHSYVQAHDEDYAAFRDFVATHPETTLLVDTFDTLEGVRTVVTLAGELGDAFRVRNIRLDSEPLGELAVEARRILDAGGLSSVRIIASGGLDEHGVADLVASGAPVDAFGVGTRAVTSSDAPTFDAVYKLVAYDREGRIKHSPGKATLPGRKQVFRQHHASGVATRDILARADERHEGEPLLVQVMRGGERLPTGEDSLEQARERAAAEIARLPERLRALDAASPPYEVVVSEALRADAARLGREWDD
ncbi:MAG: nicotinate phosphoribosyltransferase [Chloroflexi bacterium]|nr:nicotinate phosphoribosyltransferase [Chloroflexota bacterium]